MTQFISTILPNRSAPEVLCLGETMALVTPTTPVPLEVAEAFTVTVAGAESNVAMFLADTGHPAAWAGFVGNDPLGNRVINELRRQGVDMAFARSVDGPPTGVFFKDPQREGTQVYYYRGGSAASTMHRSMLDNLPLKEVQIVHVTGVTPALSPSCLDVVRDLVGRVGELGTMLSFDVNFRPGLWSAREAAPVLMSIARGAQIVFVGLDEALTLWGTETADEVFDLLNPAGVLVVKDGAIGATEYFRGAKAFVPTPPVQVVEVVGAGDAFAAGYLSGWLDGLAAEERLSRGHLLAARALTSTSDFVPTGVGR